MNPQGVLEVCYAQNYPRSLKFARTRAADYQLAEDLVQEAAWRIARLPAGKEIEKPWPYWCTTIARLAAGHFRSQAKRGGRELPLEILWHADGDVTEHDVIAAREELAGVLQAMEELTPPELRELTAHLIDCPQGEERGLGRRHATDATNHRVTLGRARRHLAELMAP